MARVSGATVILVNGQLAGFLRRRNPAIRVFLPEAEPERSATADKLAKQLAELAVRRQQGRRSGLLIAKVNEVPAREHPIGRFLEDAGFVDTALGYQMRRLASIAPSINEPEELEEPEGERETEDDEGEGGMSDALARIKVDELREIRGTALVSAGRLIVLHNLLGSQISDRQFQQLIEGLWNTNADKKLKQDQVEVLISWAKEDYFEDEVRAVLAVLNG